MPCSTAARMSRADLTNAIMVRTSIAAVTIKDPSGKTTGASWSSNLTDSVFCSADLTEANLRGANSRTRISAAPSSRRPSSPTRRSRAPSSITEGFGLRDWSRMGPRVKPEDSGFRKLASLANEISLGEPRDLLRAHRVPDEARARAAGRGAAGGLDCTATNRENSTAEVPSDELSSDNLSSEKVPAAAVPPVRDARSRPTATSVKVSSRRVSDTWTCSRKPSRCSGTRDRAPGSPTCSSALSSFSS